MKAANHSTVSASALYRYSTAWTRTGVEYVDCKESVCVRKFLGTAPHGHHDEVDDGGYAEEALQNVLVLRSLQLVQHNTSFSMRRFAVCVLHLVLTIAK